jgi:hypothetical protein
MQLALPTAAARRSLYVCSVYTKRSSCVLHPQLLLYQFAINLLLHLIYFLTHLHLLLLQSNAFIKRDAKNFVIIVALHSRCEDWVCAAKLSFRAAHYSLYITWKQMFQRENEEKFCFN